MELDFSKKKFPKIKLTKTQKSDGPAEKEMCLLRAKSKQSTKWDREETEALRLGVSKYGVGKWKKILEEYPNTFKNDRRVIDLVTKYRLLSRTSSYYKTSKRDWIMVDDQGEPDVDSLGEVIVVSQRFPYDAAQKFAKRRATGGERKFVVRIREAENIHNVHAYNVSFVDDKMEMRKLALKEDAL